LRYQDPAASISRQGQHCAVLRRQVTQAGLGICSPEVPLLIIDENGQGTSSSAADQQVRPTIAIEVGPSDSRTGFRKPARQEWIPAEIIKRSLLMHVLNQLTDISKEWDWLWRRLLGSLYGWCFVHLVKTVRLHVGQD
jgi:hypothetical protein